jgi:hypothetical protein
MEMICPSGLSTELVGIQTGSEIPAVALSAAKSLLQEPGLDPSVRREFAPSSGGTVPAPRQAPPFIIWRSKGNRRPRFAMGWV